METPVDQLAAGIYFPGTGISIPKKLSSAAQEDEQTDQNHDNGPGQAV